MQQAIYNNITTQTAQTNETTTRRTRKVGLTRRIAQSWDMVGVLALMVSSAAYGVFALAHVV